MTDRECVHGSIESLCPTCKTSSDVGGEIERWTPGGIVPFGEAMGDRLMIARATGEYVRFKDVEALQAVVNAASIWEQMFSSETQNESDQWDAEMKLVLAVQSYRKAKP